MKLEERKWLKGGTVEWWSKYERRYARCGRERGELWMDGVKWGRDMDVREGKVRRGLIKGK